ncbi:terminase small subunit [Staphylococcus aureus]|uniref:terminase small subunit n=1 Tax=Staphylococcus aureus TaxID=1280 RepID=UPI003464646B
MSELTAKQARFVNEYIRTLNVTQSAIKAGYSANSAHVTGCRLLKKPHIKQYIQEQKDKVIDENVLTAKELLHVLTNAQSVMKQKRKKLWSNVENIKRIHKVAKYS